VLKNSATEPRRRAAASNPIEVLKLTSEVTRLNNSPSHAEIVSSVGWSPKGLYCVSELAVAENTLFAFPPISRIVPTTITRITASITAYSAMSWPSSCDQSLRSKPVIFAPPCNGDHILPLSPTWCRKSRIGVVGYFEFSCSGISSATQMHPPFQLINSLPQVQVRESLSLMPNGALCFVSFQVSPHSHFLISGFMLRCSFRPPLFVGFPEGNQATVASSLKMKVAHYHALGGLPCA